MESDPVEWQACHFSFFEPTQELKARLRVDKLADGAQPQPTTRDTRETSFFRCPAVVGNNPYGWLAYFRNHMIPFRTCVDRTKLSSTLSLGFDFFPALN